MKIVAVVSRSKYLVEMESQELGSLVGGNEATWETNQREVGKEFKIREAWQTLQSLEYHKNDLPKIANKLRALADLLQPIEFEIPVAGKEAE